MLITMSDKFEGLQFFVSLKFYYNQFHVLLEQIFLATDSLWALSLIYKLNKFIMFTLLNNNYPFIY